MEEEHSEFSYDHSDPYHPKSYTSVKNKDFERQCIEESNLIQPMEDHSKPASLHLEVPYDLEQLGAYIESYHPTNSFNIYMMELAIYFIIQICTLSISKIG